MLRIAPSSQGKFGMVLHPTAADDTSNQQRSRLAQNRFCHLSEALKILRAGYTARNVIGFARLPNMAFVPWSSKCL
jgi:hypothetical protein